VDPLLLIAVLVLGLVVAGIAESYVHSQRLRRIPVRIHVNGTRGKSSVTRLIAGGLREAGIVTCAKTTGTLPRLILPDGGEYAVYRPSRANVIEQLRILDIAADYGAQAVVIECMALQPFLQWLSEWKLVRATMGVITNVRADHLDVMGPDEDRVALALAGMIPPKGTLVTGERRHLATLAKCAADRKAMLVGLDETEVASVTDEELAGFSYVEHAENVALAFKVCSLNGVDRATALRGMQKARPDPGVMTTHELDFHGRRIVFVNGFAANDPESTRRIWEMAIARFPDVERRIALVNCRADRPGRSQQLGEACPDWLPADHYVLIGSGTYIFARAAADAGLEGRKLVFAENQRADDIFEICVELAGRSALIMGLANIGGTGLDIVSFFKNRSRLPAQG
jgi:poly-gamma-glutamate synthase PgsB/CapB